MSLSKLAARLAETAFFEQARCWIEEPSGRRRHQLRGMLGSLPAFLLAYLARQTSRPLVCITDEVERAAYLYSDLEQILGAAWPLRYFPPTGHKPYDAEQVADTPVLIQRADIVQQLRAGEPGVLVTSAAALFERVPPPTRVSQETLALVVGQHLAPETLLQHLVAQQFERVEFVEQPGEFALRAGILDVYPFSGGYPIRLEFFGDEIDSIREFDVRTQRSVSRITQARIVPNLGREKDSERVSLLDYLADDAVLVIFDEARVVENLKAWFEQAEAAYQQRTVDAAPPELHYLNDTEVLAGLEHFDRLLFGTFVQAVPDATSSFDARPQPGFHSNLNLLRQRLAENTTQGLETFILCDSSAQAARLQELLEEQLGTLRLTLLVESLHEGFEVPVLGLAVYTDHQIFNRYHRPTARKQKKHYGGLSLRELRDLSPGDFVVHVDYGIGRFAGMEKITVLGKQQEAIRILYQDNDLLYVNVSALHKLHRYTGKEGHLPKLTKLGTGQWEKAKSRTKKRVKDIARDLIQLYAQRKQSKGHAFASDTVWQRELEASFEFEDTPDQAAASEAVKQDMEQPVPMDRLVCGDVGFGKTEVAVRAAFKAVQEGKQVAVLVPTTLLADQHHRTFKRRLAAFPVTIEVLSRFRSTTEQADVLARLQEGRVDILIGTHRLASQDVAFKNLGLLILDEEQRFGVGVKEQLRKLRVQVDTLTLTATPIPRTLQFSLMGARDLSIMATPPPNRQPIVTEIHTFNKDLIRDAILYETSRGGQVFFIHNRVHDIEEIALMLRGLVPNIRVRVAHGQLKSQELEAVMGDFAEQRFEVLVSTNIIENGLDISNANTILIHRADHFGLSELHQLRGRVGRSDRKAFCYLLVSSVHTLTREAKQRLQAIEEFSDLGSGFNIAMRDLDIRGAGSLLGAEQSGFIEEVGFETYHKILEEAVEELRSEEFGAVFQERPRPRAAETTVDVEAHAYIPETYLSNTVERLNLYKRLSDTPDAGALVALKEEMQDRFGPLPPEVEHLIQAATLRLCARQLRLARVQFKNQRLFLEPPASDQDPWFYDHLFHPLLQRLSTEGHRYVLKETDRKRLRIIVQDVPTLARAQQVLETLMPADVGATAAPVQATT